MENDDIVYQARLHWVLFLWPALFFFINLYLGVNFQLFRHPAMILGTGMVLWFLVLVLMYRFCSITIKKNRLTLKSGVLVRRTTDIPMSKVESIDVRQSVMGTLLGFGTIEIAGTGGTREVIDYVARPLTCRRYIEQIMHH